MFIGRRGCGTLIRIDAKRVFIGMKRVILAVPAAFLLSACSLVGIRSGYEQPPYEVVTALDDNIEIRAYAPRVAAEATVQGQEDRDGRNAAFRLLFDYITGANRSNNEIAMTAPVETGSASEEVSMTVPVETAGEGASGMRMRFFLPAAYSADSAPTPSDPRVRVVELPPQTVAVLRFNGSSGEDAIAAKTETLLAALDNTSYQAAGEPFALFYDPPWTLPFFRRNEVVVEVTR